MLSITFTVNKCGGSCNNIDDPYAWVCVPNKSKTINIKIFNVMSRINETKFIDRHELCQSKCISNENVCNLIKKMESQ